MCVCLSSLCFAQTTGKIQLYVQPWGQTAFIVDGEHMSADVHAVEVTEGAHRFRFWAPGRSVLDTVLIAYADSTVGFHKVLSLTPEFRAHQKEVDRTQRARFWWRAAPAAGLLASGTWALLANKRYNNAYDELQAANDSYYSTTQPGEIVELKEGVIPEKKEEFAEAGDQLTVALCAVGVSSLATVYGWIRARRIEDPPPYEDREKVRFEGMSCIPLPSAAGQGWYASLTFTIP